MTSVSIDRDRLVETASRMIGTHSFTGDEAQRQLDTAVEWGRYAEAFTYDDTTGQLRLDEEHRDPAETEPTS